jgi:hypothetical protein
MTICEPRIATMDVLTAQLDSLLRLYAASHDAGEGDVARARVQFRKELAPLVAQHGRRAVITSLNKLAGAPSRSVTVDAPAIGSRAHANGSGRLQRGDKMETRRSDLVNVSHQAVGGRRP